MNMYSLNFAQCVNLIATIGNQQSILIEGDMGVGKSSIQTALQAKFPDHAVAYFDMTTKDLGDIMIPDLVHGADSAEGYVAYLLNEELAMHTGKPVIIMLDEFGKGNRAVQQALTRLLQERQLGSVKLHPDSILFATTNLSAEGVGDMLAAHTRNRITVVRMAKPDADEWLEWGINNGVDPIVLGWVRENPHVMQSFTEVTNPDDNPYIYHPKAQRPAFVTPRSLEKASIILAQREHLDERTVTASLIGTVGGAAALDMAAFIALADKLPTRKQIIDSPDTAPIPDSASAICMIVFRALGSIDREWCDQWFTYMNRLSKEAQGMFVNGMRAPEFPKDRKKIIQQAKGFTEWCLANDYMFKADI